MKLPLYQVDSFADHVFEGNPAAVVPLDSWLDDRKLQAIASENNLSETAFYTPDFRLRWFAPRLEVSLCGHATLAAAYVYFHREKLENGKVVFHSISGELPVEKRGGQLFMDFPLIQSEPWDLTEEVIQALGIDIDTVTEGRSAGEDKMIILENESDVKKLEPNFSSLKRVETCRGFIVSAPGDDYDFVSRFFAPLAGIDEDPVTGSAHCAMAPFWSDKLGKSELIARQISERAGVVNCRVTGDRVILGGRVVPFLEGEIEI